MPNQPFVAPKGTFRLEQDWPWTSPHRPRPANLPAKGDLLFLPQRHKPRKFEDGKTVIMSNLNQGYSTRLEDLAVEPNPALTHRDFDALLKMYFQGWAPLPNIEHLPTDKGLDLIASWGGAYTHPHIAHLLVPKHNKRNTSWGRVLLGTTQGGQLDGTGVFCFWKGHWKSEVSQIARFALCKHKKHTTSSFAQRQRGWHPGRCTRCGLDMTVDSSD